MQDCNGWWGKRARERGKARNQFDFYCFARSASNWPYITVNFIQISLAPHRTLPNTSSCGFHLSSLRSLFSFSIHWSKKLRNAFVRVESTTVVYCLYWWEASQLTCSHLSGLNLQWAMADPRRDKFSLARLTRCHDNAVNLLTCARESDTRIWKLKTYLHCNGLRIWAREAHQSSENKCTRLETLLNGKHTKKYIK